MKLSGDSSVRHQPVRHRNIPGKLQDRFGDVVLDSAPTRRGGSADAVRALENLGYPPATAEEAVRLVLDDTPGADTAAVVRRALQQLTGTKGGRRG